MGTTRLRLSRRGPTSSPIAYGLAAYYIRAVADTAGVVEELAEDNTNLEVPANNQPRPFSPL